MGSKSDWTTYHWTAPKAAYVHVPFCRHRCGYCNFSVVAGREDWIDRFLKAIDGELATLDRPAVTTVFLGGGTPTHLDQRQLERLLSIVRQRFDLSSCREWSLEANPEDITADKLELIAALGVNRISLGVQSFDDQKLRQLERSHDRRLVEESVHLSASRIANVSIDLIFGSPGETLSKWESDLDSALRLPIQHLSTYALTFEKGTTFWNRLQRGLLRPIDEAEEVEMYQLARRRADESGLEQYEISNFARPGYQCLHNLAYWEGTGWFAAGPGAARFVEGVREVNHRSTATYLRRMEAGHSPVAERESISVPQYARERAAFGIRMLAGIDLGALSRSVALDVARLCHDAIALSAEQGLLEREGDRLRLTPRGILFADTVASRLLG